MKRSYMKGIIKLSRITAATATVFAAIWLMLSGKIDSKNSSTKTWRLVLSETKRATFDKQLPLFAAGVSYFGTLAFFPLMVALVAIAALVIDTSKLQDVLATV